MLSQEKRYFTRSTYRTDRVAMKILNKVSRFLLGLIFLIFGLQVISGALLLVNRFVPLALTILAAIIVNILLFHVLMNPAGLGLAVFAAILWGVVFASVRSAFAGIFQARVDMKTAPVRVHSRVVS